jgi:hypothetical protein
MPGSKAFVEPRRNEVRKYTLELRAPKERDMAAVWKILEQRGQESSS